MNEEAPRLVTAADLAKQLGTTGKTILEWYHKGRISAEVAEGRVIRFDAEKVRETLRLRATRKKMG